MIGTLAFYTVLGIGIVTVGTYYAARATESENVRRETLSGFLWAVGASAVVWTFVGAVVVLG